MNTLEKDFLNLMMKELYCYIGEICDRLILPTQNDIVSFINKFYPEFPRDIILLESEPILGNPSNMKIVLYFNGKYFEKKLKKLEEIK
jgi:hypothetical protein